MLWLHLARARGRKPDADEFQGGMRRLDLSDWPKPIFDMFLGKLTPIEVLNAGSCYRGGAPDPRCDGQERECEHAIFGGEYELTLGDTLAAKPLLEEASSVCDHRENQFFTAWAEVRRLNPSIPPNYGPW